MAPIARALYLLACIGVGLATASCAPIKYFGDNRTDGQMTDSTGAATANWLKAHQ